MEHSKVFSMVSFCTLPTPKRHQRVRQALHWGSEGRTTELERLLVTLLIRPSLSVWNLHRRKEVLSGFWCFWESNKDKVHITSGSIIKAKQEWRKFWGAGLFFTALSFLNLTMVSTTDKQKECNHVTGRGFLSSFTSALLQLVISKLICNCGMLSKALAQEIHFLS